MSIKSIYEEIIRWLETHDGEMPRAYIKKNGEILKIAELTEEERIEVHLYTRWNRSQERKVLNEYAGRPIEELSEEFRDKILKLRNLGLGTTTYLQIIEWLETHDGKMPRGCITEKGRKLKVGELTEEERIEVQLYTGWNKSLERKILDEYAEKPIEEVPEEFRDKIAKLRSLGQLGKKKDDKVKDRMKSAVSAQVENNDATRNELGSERTQKKVDTDDEYSGFPEN